MKKTRGLITIISCLLLVGALCLAFFLDDVLSGIIIDIVTVITALIGAIALFIQFKKDKDINETEFIIRLGVDFYDQTGPKDIMNKLEKYRKSKSKSGIFTKDDYDNIVTYLQWCEELAFVVNKGVLKISDIDELMSYRFFLITNNEYIQKTELIPEREFYRGIYKLHKEWTEYKRKKKLYILGEDTSLEKIYKDEIKVADKHTEK